MRRRPRRLLLNIATLVCLLLTAATLALWVRSLFVSHHILRFSDIQPFPGHRSGFEYRYDCTVAHTAVAGGRLTFVRRAGATNDSTPHWRYHESRREPADSFARDGWWRQFILQTVAVSSARIWIVPLWIIALPWAIVPAWRTIGHLCSRRPQQGLCPACGYDLRATLDRCPECGTSALDSPRRAAR